MGMHLAGLVALSFLLIHEMDAIRLREWRLFLLLSSLSDETGYRVFTALHIPIYVLLLWALFMGQEPVNRTVIIAFDIFCIVHVGLHLLFINHPHHEFRTWFSWLLIIGAGFSGAIDLINY